MSMLIFIGWDAREAEAFEVCEYSLRKRAAGTVKLFPIVLDQLQRDRLYTRPTIRRDGELSGSERSDAPMSTEFAISRFFVPVLAGRLAHSAEWAMFCDCDFLWLSDVGELFEAADPSKALCCVQHDYRPDETTKMDGQAQLFYARKNWSSLMLFNLRHPAHERLSMSC